MVPPYLDSWFSPPWLRLIWRKTGSSSLASAITDSPAREQLFAAALGAGGDHVRVLHGP